MQQQSITEDRHVRIATEGALLGGVLNSEINPMLVIGSDDAGQFNVLLHALCWIHAERILAKLVGFNDAQRKALEEMRTAVWNLYRVFWGVSLILLILLGQSGEIALMEVLTVRHVPAMTEESVSPLQSARRTDANSTRRWACWEQA